MFFTMISSFGWIKLSCLVLFFHPVVQILIHSFFFFHRHFLWWLQETNQLMVHLFGAALAFGVGGLYLWMQWVLNFMYRNGCCIRTGRKLLYLRLVCNIVNTVCFFTSILSKFINFVLNVLPFSLSWQQSIKWADSMKTLTCLTDSMHAWFLALCERTAFKHSEGASFAWSFYRLHRYYHAFYLSACVHALWISIWVFFKKIKPSK